MTELPVLKSPHCVLSRITEEDVPVLRQIFDDESTRKYLQELQSLVRSDEGIKRMLTSFDALQKKGESMIWGVRLRDVMIGFVAIMDLSCKPTIIYAMHPDYRRNGYMKECVVESVRFLFYNNLCNYVQTEVHNDNVASIQLLQSIGFKLLKQDDQKTYLLRNCEYTN